MILADSSAWIAYLRGTGSKSSIRVRELVGTGQLASTEPVLMELLTGAQDEARVTTVRRLVTQNDMLTMSVLEDFESAASIYRSCRRQGRTIRSLTDCLIAAVAIRHDVPVLHEDRDFEAIAGCSSLETVTC